MPGSFDLNSFIDSYLSRGYAASQQNYSGGEGNGSFSGVDPMSQTPEQRRSGFSATIRQGQPGFSEIAEQLGYDPGNTIFIGPHVENSWFRNPHGAVNLGNNTFAFGREALNDKGNQLFFRGSHGGLDPQIAGIAAALMGGAALAFGGLGGAIEGTTVEGATGGLGAGGLDPETLAGAGGMGGPAGGGTATVGGGLGAGGLDPETLGGAGGMSGGPPISGGLQAGGSAGGNAFSTFNRVRQGFSLANSLFGSSGRSGGTRSGSRPNAGGTGMPFDFSSLLQMIGSGRSAGLWGGGVGTPSGATEVGNRAAGMADPWGASGRRQQFNDVLTPEYVQNLLHPDPTKDPEFNFLKQQGTSAINMADARTGTLRSGNRGIELEQFGQGLASTFTNDIFNRNMQGLQFMGNAAGIGASSPTAAAGSVVGAFEGATSLQNAGLNSLIAPFMNPLQAGGSSGSNPIMSLLNSIFKGGSGTDPGSGGTEVLPGDPTYPGDPGGGGGDPSGLGGFDPGNGGGIDIYGDVTFP